MFEYLRFGTRLRAVLVDFNLNLQSVALVMDDYYRTLKNPNRMGADIHFIFYCSKLHDDGLSYLSYILNKCDLGAHRSQVFRFSSEVMLSVLTHTKTGNLDQKLLNALPSEIKTSHHPEERISTGNTKSQRRRERIARRCLSSYHSSGLHHSTADSRSYERLFEKDDAEQVSQQNPQSRVNRASDFNPFLHTEPKASYPDNDNKTVAELSSVKVQHHQPPQALNHDSLINSVGITPSIQTIDRDTGRVTDRTILGVQRIECETTNDFVASTIVDSPCNGKRNRRPGNWRKKKLSVQDVTEKQSVINDSLNCGSSSAVSSVPGKANSYVVGAHRVRDSRIREMLDRKANPQKHHGENAIFKALK